MIFGNSKDPVRIKKISLRIWLLRDELEALLMDELARHDHDPSKIDKSKITNIYSRKELKQSGTLNLVPDLDASKEETEEALASSSEGEEKSEDVAEGEAATAPEGEEQAEEEESSNPLMVNPSTLPEHIKQKDDGTFTVSQRQYNIPDDKVVLGRSILSEINIDKMLFFSNKPFIEGQSVVMEFDIPKRFILNADILFCRPYSMKSRIISENKLPYRVAAKFTFLKEGERTLLRHFIGSIEPDREIVATAKSEEGDDDHAGAPEGDEFDELNALDDFDI